MGLKQSKEELLYQQVNYGNIEGIKTLYREGAGLEWIDKEGRTPLILACMRPDLLHIAKDLIDMGANVNAYRPGSHAGTPLHHAAKRGLDNTVILLLSHRANPLVMNDDCQTPLDLARAKGHSNVVRAIETRICLFSGWLREINGPSILEAIAPQWVSKKIWVVVLPCDSRNPTNPTKFELAVYPDLQVSQPRSVVALWKVQIEEPKFNQPDPAMIIVDSTKKTRFKFLSAQEGDKQQIHWFYNACRGLYQHNNSVPVAAAAGAPPLPNQSAYREEDVELAMAINASIQTALVEGAPLPNGWAPSNRPNTNVGPAASAPQLRTEAPPIILSQEEAAAAVSAPPISELEGHIYYPSIDSSPIDLIVPPIEDGSSSSNASVSTCVICMDAAVEGACIPCGHMAGCMSCLEEIKEKRGHCPVCRANIAQVVRLYAV